MTAKILHKTIEKSAGAGGMDFVLSDETPDRMNDIILSSSWDITQFKKNPICLFNHQATFPLGRWADVRVEGNALKGRLILAPAGTSDRIDEIRRLVEANILRAVSVGFRPIEWHPRKDVDRGDVFTKCSLLETSLVSVPANPNAIAVAKRLNISPDTRELVFKNNHIRRSTAYSFALLAATAATRHERDRWLERLKG